MEKEPKLDLCHLTEVEQTVILNVLLRDAELRSKEEGRIRSVCVQYWTNMVHISHRSNKRYLCFQQASADGVRPCPSALSLGRVVS